jgi:hypothetical protein
MQLSQVVPGDAKEKGGGSALFLVIFAGMPDQRQESVLNNVRSRLWASAHMHSVPVESTLMAAVELQKSVIISCCETPQKFDIACFDWLRHLPRLNVAPALPL